MDKRTELTGIELTEEQIKQITRTSVQVGVDTEAFAEAIGRVVTAFAEVWQALREMIKDMWQIKEFIDNHNTITDIRPERKGWWIPRKIIKDHQVFDRRPAVVYIRSEI